jgi:hypothetical protein
MRNSSCGGFLVTRAGPTSIFAQQAMRLGARTVLNLKALRPVPFFDGIIEPCGLDQALRADPFDLVVGLVPDALVNEDRVTSVRVVDPS